MIRVAIKHFIYEKCISVIFNAIAMNFKRAPKFKFKKGMFIFYIKFTPQGQSKVITAQHVNVLSVMIEHISVAAFINEKHVTLWIHINSIKSIGNILEDNLIYRIKRDTARKVITK